jgi:hypothetical protein
MATERVYLYWVRRFITFHEKRHPKEMGKEEIEVFLRHLAVNRKVSPSTQNAALASILYLYKKVLDVDLPWMDDVVHRGALGARSPLDVGSHHPAKQA